MTSRPVSGPQCTPKPQPPARRPQPGRDPDPAPVGTSPPPTRWCWSVPSCSLAAVGAVPRLGQYDDQSVSTNGPAEHRDHDHRAPHDDAADHRDHRREHGDATPARDHHQRGHVTPGRDHHHDPASTTVTRPRVASTAGRRGTGVALGASTPRRVRRQMDVTGQFRVSTCATSPAPRCPGSNHFTPRRSSGGTSRPGSPTIRLIQARWLVVRRAPGLDTEAIAARSLRHHRPPRSPDGEPSSATASRKPVEGLPGQWAGVNYDFVTGEDSEQPGPPD